MNRQLVLAEWSRASLSLKAARLLAKSKIYPDAVSRCYYALLHAAKAALETRGVGAESHAAVKRQFGLHLVKTGLIEPKWAADLSEGLDDRLAADYDSELPVPRRLALDEIRRVRAFMKRMREYLVAQGISRNVLSI